MPEEPYEIPIGKSMIAREGTDVTLLGAAYTTIVCQEAADMLAAEGYSAEVIDLLSISPLDEETILESVKKTRKIVIVGRGLPALQHRQRHFGTRSRGGVRLSRRPRRGGVVPPHTSVPYSLPLEMAYLPAKERVYEAALSVLE